MNTTINYTTNNNMDNLADEKTSTFKTIKATGIILTSIFALLSCRASTDEWSTPYFYGIIICMIVSLTVAVYGSIRLIDHTCDNEKDNED